MSHSPFIRIVRLLMIPTPRQRSHMVRSRVIRMKFFDSKFRLTQSFHDSEPTRNVKNLFVNIFKIFNFKAPEYGHVEIVTSTQRRSLLDIARLSSRPVILKLVFIIDSCFKTILSNVLTGRNLRKDMRIFFL